MVLDKPPTPGATGELINPSVHPDRPYTMIIHPAYLLSELSPIAHEAYHIHQLIRDNQKLHALDFLLTGSAFLLLYILVGHFMDKADYISRRKFLSFFSKVGIASAIGMQNSPFLVPHELQAYMQTDSDVQDALVNNPYFKFSPDDLFDLEK